MNKRKVFSYALVCVMLSWINIAMFKRQEQLIPLLFYGWTFFPVSNMLSMAIIILEIICFYHNIAYYVTMKATIVVRSHLYLQKLLCFRTGICIVAFIMKDMLLIGSVSLLLIAGATVYHVLIGVLMYVLLSHKKEMKASFVIVFLCICMLRTFLTYLCI